MGADSQKEPWNTAPATKNWLADRPLGDQFLGHLELAPLAAHLNERRIDLDLGSLLPLPVLLQELMHVLLHGRGLGALGELLAAGLDHGDAAVPDIDVGALVRVVGLDARACRSGGGMRWLTDSEACKSYNNQRRGDRRSMPPLGASFAELQHVKGASWRLTSLTEERQTQRATKLLRAFAPLISDWEVGAVDVVLDVVRLRMGSE